MPLNRNGLKMLSFTPNALFSQREKLTFNQEVLGSSPSALTTFLRLVRTAYDEILMENKQEHHSGFTPGFTVSVLASFFSRLDIAASASSRRPPR